MFSLFLPPGWRDSLIGIVLGGGSLWLMGELYFRIRHEEGMGFGDVKMLAMIGAFLGWKLMLLTLVLSSFLGSIVGVAMIAFNRGDMKYALPFGTFLAVGAHRRRGCRRLASSRGTPRSIIDGPADAITEPERVRADRSHRDGRGADWRSRVRRAEIRFGGARVAAAPARKQERVGVCHRRAARGADQS